MNKMQKTGFVKAFLLVTFQDLYRVTLSFLITKKISRTKVMNHILNLNMLLGM